MNSTVTALALDRWTEMVGITSVTAWRWRKRGIIRTTNIGGRQYILPDDHAEFLRRAAAGDFAIQLKTPHPQGAKRKS
jgi:predicted site-specific integrase-resolvase